MKTLRALHLPARPEVLDRLGDLSAVLDGSAAYVPVPDDVREVAALREALGVDEVIDDDVSLVVSTSGTTGVPKGAQHTAATLAASATATATRLGGPGNWLLALAPHHIAGVQVLLRALASGFTPAALDVTDGFDPDAFADALENLDGPRRYTSLVPTQLIKVLDSPRATAALREADALMVGGAATPIPLLRRAIDAGVPITRTYGMSETAGGCVYDGIPLDGVTVRIDDPNPEGVGRVILGGTVVAHGYRNRPDHPAFVEPGWFRTDDLGHLDDAGVLSIVGRADEAISSGGLTIVPQVVEAVILDDPAVAECAVVGVPDDRLGEKVVVFVVASGTTTLDPNRIRGAVAERLDRYAAPREVIELPDLPTRGPGKVDRRALRARYSG
ncbi:o-succinylbenzoate--CoA ligase [Gordonia sp. DT218]|uniref:o-succinylbenzoate--CoA ligase n=1 Tax=Gordonia sp. DT218 TaxID=3416659 RepID=UPI003CF05E43